MVLSTPPEVPLEVPSFVVVAADEAELYFPPPPEGPLVVSLPEVVALPVLEDPPSPAEDPPTSPPPPQLASTMASTSMKATKASVPFSDRSSPLASFLWGNGVGMGECTEHMGESYNVGPLKSSARSNIPMLPKGQPHPENHLGGAKDPHAVLLFNEPHPDPTGALGADHPQPRMSLRSKELY